MFKPYYGTCTGTRKQEGCGGQGLIKTSSRLLCESCEKDKKKAPKLSKLLKDIQPREKESKGELALFMSIWATRPHRCQISGEPIKNFDIRCFSHVLSKGAFPNFRLYDKNIVLKSPEMHEEYTIKAESDLLKDSRWKWFFDLKKELIAEYYSQDDNGL